MSAASIFSTSFWLTCHAAVIPGAIPLEQLRKPSLYAWTFSATAVVDRIAPWTDPPRAKVASTRRIFPVTRTPFPDWSAERYGVHLQGASAAPACDPVSGSTQEVRTRTTQAAM